MRAAGQPHPRYERVNHVTVRAALGVIAWIALICSLARTAPDQRVQFVEIAAESGVNFRHENGASKEKHMPETFGSGVAWIDYDNDGWIDLFFANGADVAHGKRSPGNVLLRNLG